MAVINQRIEVCDVCRRVGEPVTKFRAAFGGGRLRTFALCDADGGPVKELLAKLGSGTVAQPPARSSKVLSMEELDAVKQARAPKRRRRA
jgi:hypothetical protein